MQGIQKKVNKIEHVKEEESVGVGGVRAKPAGARAFYSKFKQKNKKCVS